MYEVALFNCWPFGALRARVAFRILQKQGFTDAYKEKYKGMAVALQILSNIISGSYCHYEVFEVYGDTVLNDSLRLALQMCLAIPQDGEVSGQCLTASADLLAALSTYLVVYRHEASTVICDNFWSSERKH